MALSEADRQQLLADIGLEPEGEHLTLAAPPEAPAVVPVSTGVGIPDVEALTNEQLLAPDAFDRYKLAAREVGRVVSSPYNQRLYARIQELRNRLREAELQGRREAREARRKEGRTHVREKVKADTVERTKAAVLAELRAAGVLPEEG